MSGLTIAKARREDAGALTQIAFAAKRHWGYPEPWIRSWETALTIVPEYVVRHPTFIATVDEALAGFCAVKLAAHDALLDHLWVLPRFMGRGIGRALFEHAEAVARAGGATRMKIVGDPHAEGFYARMGAQVHGRESADMDGVQRFLPLLEKAL